MGLFGSNQLPVEGKTILLTGATQGLGRAAAVNFAGKGANIVIVARNEVKLAEVIAELKAAAKSPSQQFYAVPADISVQGYAADLLSKVLHLTNGALDIVWCVAGMSTPLLTEDPRFIPAMRRNMDVNFWGAAELAQAVFTEWTRLRPEDDKSNPVAVKQPVKHLVFTASVLALFSVAGYGPYNPTKWAVRGLADTMAQEAMLYPDTPVKVHVVFPAGILSPGFENENMSKPGVTLEIEKDDEAMPPEKVAQKCIEGLERGDHFVTVEILGEMMRWSVIGGSLRNGWIMDTIGAWLSPIIWFIAQFLVFGTIKGYAKKHGHPSTWPKKPARPDMLA